MSIGYKQMIESLGVGESFARAVRLDPDLVSKDEMQRISRNLRLATQPTVYHVARETGATFTIEAGEFRTASRDVVVCLAVTRMQ